MWKVKHLQHSSSISFVQESRSVQSKLLGLERTERLILRILLFLLKANWVITEELGMNLDNVELDMLGLCKEEALDTGNCSRIRILMRFLTVLIQFFLAALKALSRKEIHYGAYATSEQLKPDARGPVLCFVGPPGVGKTSLASSIAAALGRKFVRISLGGVKDDADIRGHWRTYIRSMPGRLIDGLKRVAVCNPVMLLDEIDKTGSDVRGDPASALLEVLDPEQNKRFNDQYPISFRIFLSLRFFYINLIRVM